MFQRALVIIGVSQPGGGLDPLQSIPGSVQRMVDWATDQHFQRIVIHTDVDLSGTITPGPSLVVHCNAAVRIGDISDTIEQLDSAPVPPNQLVVYFNGHGLRSNSFGDLWLLSKAPQQEMSKKSL